MKLCVKQTQALGGHEYSPTDRDHYGALRCAGAAMPGEGAAAMHERGP